MSEPVARLLMELEDITPRIWRRVDVPTGITLATLHEVIQAVMRWEYAHLFEFRVSAGFANSRTVITEIPGHAFR